MEGSSVEASGETPLQGCCRHLQAPFFDMKQPSEAEIVRTWIAVFESLAPRGTVISRSEECVSVSLEEEHTDFDLMFFSADGGQELSSFKVNRGLSKGAYRLQYLKNVRLNRAIMENQYKTSGIRPAIPFMCFNGWECTLSVLYQYKGIFVSKELHNICLPTTKEGLAKLLEGKSLQIIQTVMVWYNIFIQSD
ncbi:hypothetical protein BGZ65_009046 [Modicella reniformis]|uniref:Uncharacterized protein n=1 Tax=Modicella reniformis TaxID=1440133 RepID=A0A9P6M1D7_9FUNG|nr:hypothetical protein BGZ65_009046 [Modicella reniformis]